MLKGNLSTRPFYNDRIVTVAIVVAAVLVAAASVVNISQLVRLSSERSAVRARLEADATEAARIRTQAEALQGQVDRVTLARLASSAREANQLIDQRTFSWTRLLGQLEDTLPPGVRLTAISPRAERGEFRVSLAVVARDLSDIDAFIDALLETGAFYDVAPIEQRANDDGTYQAVVQASYLSPRATVLGQAATPVAGGQQP
jgi:Tfp pilus assembly protein PilN